MCLEWGLLSDLKFFCAKNPRNNFFLGESYNRVPYLSWKAFHCNINLFYILFLFQGSSKANVHMEWDKIWALNKKVCREKNRIKFLKILFLTHFFTKFCLSNEGEFLG